MTPTYRFYDRPEGWTVAFEFGQHEILITGQSTERDAVRELNKELALKGLHKHMLFASDRSLRDE